MRLGSPSFADGEAIPDRFALGTPAVDGHVTFAENINPALFWEEVPPGTRSFALICADPDCPSMPQDVNVEGREVPEDLPRGEFVHWALVDLPATVRRIDEGEFASGVVPHGRVTPQRPDGVRQGLNDYTGWYAEDQAMAGRFHGYDGPGPPWNDSVLHHYVFTLYALDVENVGVEGDFTAPDVLGAIEGHVIESASYTGTYTLNRRLRPRNGEW